MKIEACAVDWGRGWFGSDRPDSDDKWASLDRPYRPSRFAAQFMLNVGFVEASAMSVVGQQVQLGFKTRSVLQTDY
jgi:hypothetical protein